MGSKTRAVDSRLLPVQSAEAVVSEFPIDDTTLTLLIASCQINPDSGHTHLHDFLDMGTRIKSSTLIHEGDQDLGGFAGAPVYEVEFEEGYEPFSEQHVIQTLAEELMDCRAKLAAFSRQRRTWRFWKW